jgi:hypothetical protein
LLASPWPEHYAVPEGLVISPTVSISRFGAELENALASDDNDSGMARTIQPPLESLSIL